MLPDPILTIGNAKVYMYGVMIAVGILACFGVLTLFGKWKKISDKLIDFCYFTGVFAIAAGVLTSMLFQGLYNYLQNPAKGFHLGQGMTFIGGLIGGVALFLAVYFFWRRRNKERLIDILPMIPSVITVAHAFGRIGCFFAGCCYGKTTGTWLDVDFPNIGPHLPVQLFESAFLFILFGVCSYLYLKKNFKYTFTVYLIGYGIWRFCIEFLRGDNRGKFIGSLSPSQFWSICMVIAGVGVYFLIRYLSRKREAELAAPAKDTAPASGEAEEKAE